MSLSRGKRATKPVNYCAIQNVSSDDDNDFCDFTPPTKRVKETKKKTKLKKEAEIVDFVSNDLCKNSPKKRLTPEERKFQREIELALELSSGTAEPFQGFNKKSAEDKENELEFFSPLRQTLIDVEVHPEPRIEKAEDPGCFKDHDASHLKKTKEVNSKDITSVTSIIVNNNEHSSNIQDLRIEIEKLDSIKESKSKTEEVSPPQPKNCNNISVESLNSDKCAQQSRKKKKRVNFIDDESDGFSENEIEECPKSETDESDYFPSPSKSKRKKETKKSAKKNKDKDSKNKKDNDRKPLNVKQMIKEDKSFPQLKKDTEVCNSSPKVYNKEAISKVIVFERKCCLTPKSTSASEGKYVPSKAAFQSPLLNQSTNLSPKAPSRIGLRLGLSRKAPLKPLHPNASTK